MQIANGRILIDNALFERRDVLLHGDRIDEITAPYYESDEELVIDAEGGYVIPGLIDLCVRDTAENDAELAATAARLARQGVTRWLAGLPWQGAEQTAARLADLAAFAEANKKAELPGAVPEGARLEGPFLAASRAALCPENAAADCDEATLDRLAELAGKNLRMMDFAPELPRATVLAKKLAKLCRLSVGYTGAGYDQTRIAFALGASHVSDLGGMLGGCTPEAPGALAAAAEGAGLVDLCPCAPGLHPAALRMAVQLFGPDRLCFVSRSSGVGKTPGTLADCLRTAAWYGVPLPYAVKATSLNPARALGIEKEVGSIEQGKRADLVVLDLHDLSLRTVVLGGKLIYDKHEMMSLGG